MKYKIFLLLMLFSSIFSYGIVKANNLVLIGKVIYIDAGHGGVDPGAIHKNLRESDINLVFSRELGMQLEKMGATVLYTREGDYDLSSTKNMRKRSDLSNRVKIINDSAADMYLSIHVNAESSSSWYGTQIFYNTINKHNVLIAESVQKYLKKHDISKRKISKIVNVYMYDKIKIPGILLEIGFISNYSDRIKMQNEEYIKNFCNIIVEAVVNYFEENI